MKRSKIDQRIRVEEAREGLLGLYLVAAYRKHRVSLKRASGARKDNRRLKVYPQPLNFVEG